MIFKKLSLMGLLVTAVVGTTAYGMEPQDPNQPDPSQIRAQQKAARNANKAAWKNFGRNLAANLLAAPDIQQALGPQVTARFEEKMAHSENHAAEREFNKTNYGLEVIDRELANQAANDPEGALLMVASIDPALEIRLVTKRPDLQARINTYK